MIKKQIEQTVIEVSSEDFEKLGANYINNCKPVSKHQAEAEIKTIMFKSAKNNEWLDLLVEYVNGLAFAHKIVKALNTDSPNELTE